VVEDVEMETDAITISSTAKKLVCPVIGTTLHPPFSILVIVTTVLPELNNCIVLKVALPAMNETFLVSVPEFASDNI
jgi:hypothetical protein